MLPTLLLAATAHQIVPLVVISIYLAVVLYIGIFAFRVGKTTGEDFFMASRSIGSIVFFLSLFATNMTAVAILGSSGFAYKRGIGVFGLMASASGFVIPITLFVIGTRLWALGKRFGHMTQVAFFRDRWECSGIGTVIFLMTAAMLIPYLIVSIVGGGTILEALTGGLINYHVAGAIVALVVMGNVFFGGMRGAVLVNVFQTILFLSFGAIAFVAIGKNMGFHDTVMNLMKTPGRAWPLQRLPTPGDENMKRLMLAPMSYLEFFSYCFIPLSSIMFPHMSIMCLTAKKVTAFKKTVVLYPLCIMAIWLPSVYLGAIANGQPKVNAAIASGAPDVLAFLKYHGGPDENGKPTAPILAKLLKDTDTPESRALLADVADTSKTIEPNDFGEKLYNVVHGLGGPQNPKYAPFVAEVGRLSKQAPGDSVLLQMLRLFVPAWLGGLLAAGIISAVMGSDCHQILALSTMFTKDVFDYYGGRQRFGEKGTVFVGRLFILVANTIAFAIAWKKPDIFELAISWAFSGFAALAPVMLAALFWKRSTKWGALVSVLFVTACILGVGYLEHHYRLPPGSKPAEVVINGATLAGHHFLSLSPGGGKLFIFGFMPVVFMVLGSALFMVVVSMLTPPPSEATIRKYFDKDYVEPVLTPKRGFEPTIAA